MCRDMPILDWCPEETARRVYRGQIREAKVGSLTAETFEVWELERVRLGFLQPFPAVNYSDDSYRNAVNDSASIDQYFKLHATQQPGYLALFRQDLHPGMTVADCGCGGGALLDLVKQVTGARTIAVEPFAGYHSSLRERGHEVFPTTEAAVEAHGGKADLVLSFHVIEHVLNPVAYLQAMRGLVREGGLGIVVTPNWDDILVKVDAERMNPFFFRRVHNYYLTAQSLRWLGERAGWSIDRDVFYQEFGLANALQWLRDGRPAGHTRLPSIREDADQFWKSYLEATGQSNHVGVILRK